LRLDRLGKVIFKRALMDSTNLANAIITVKAVTAMTEIN
jgi:hypothetical protein